MPSFIETQFPVSKLSKESYKERKANYSQTLTGLGKWWGRKPLILVRAIILGLLLPTSDNPKKDREIFLKILTMDNEGLWQRKTKSISMKDIYSRFKPSERLKWFADDSSDEKPKYKKGITPEQKQKLQHFIFNTLSYDEKLEYCDRPEQTSGASPETWQEINAHLHTNAENLPQLIQQLGERQFGHTPRVGDAFCGGGSIPFEAARIGCEAYGSDLNPVAALLTWAALNIVGGGEEVAKQVREAQQQVYDAVDAQITAWGIEHNKRGWRADAYLYCNETKCPECGWMVPLAPSWVIGEKTLTVAKLQPDEENQRFEIIIESDVSASEIKAAKAAGTVKDSSLNCPHCHQSTPMTMIRGDRRSSNVREYGLRLWENDDIVPRNDDVFQERLYCIRWERTYVNENALILMYLCEIYNSNLINKIIVNLLIYCKSQLNKITTDRIYCAPNENDLSRESKAIQLLTERFHDWQKKGYIPSRKIEPGEKTDEPIRTRGWTYWHHLFNPRQLLTLGLFWESIDKYSVYSNNNNFKILSILGTGRCCDYNAKLSRWHPNGANEKSEQVFSNQALNTLFNYGARTVFSLQTAFEIQIPNIQAKVQHFTQTRDARLTDNNCDLWITDPPYADAVNYHELTEFFLAWYEKHIIKLFPNWYTDSKRALAITGRDENFRKSMADCYRNLAKNMPDNGIQVVMFTHQDAGVWADLALILWASGLRVTAAWCIATETDSALKEGNYVQGTVLLILRKQTSEDTAFLDELYPQVEIEVKTQLDSMLALEDNDDPNFSDTDYQLAAYAAALRVLTQYKNIEDFDIAYELSKPRKKGETSEIEKLIADAVKIACDYLVPKDFDTFIWKILKPEERFYLKGLDIETHGEYRSGAYQELARGFGIKEYKSMLDSGKANETRLKTASEFATKQLGDIGFGISLVRNTLFAIREIVRTGETQKGKTWLRTEIKDYWNQRKNIIQILQFLSAMGLRLTHWQTDADAARLLAGALENDSI
jgi:adenine-specific DNA methylase